MTIRKSLWATMTLFSVIFAIISWRFIFGPDAVSQEGFGHFLENHALATYLHFGFSPLALLIGGFQFSSKLRVFAPSIHRGIGWLYIFSCLTASVGGLILAINTKSGMAVATGFGALAVVWFFTTFQAIRYAMQGNYADHQTWMVRSFALTFAGVTFRVIFLGFFSGVVGWDFAFCYSVGAWSCWILNLAAAEYWFQGKRGPLIKQVLV